MIVFVTETTLSILLKSYPAERELRDACRFLRLLLACGLQLNTIEQYFNHRHGHDQTGNENQYSRQEIPFHPAHRLSDIDGETSSLAATGR